MNGGNQEFGDKMNAFDVGNQQQIQMESKENYENAANGAALLPPRTPNYGKTPKYITKYKEEAKIKE